jgi:hypothetical protein
VLRKDSGGQRRDLGAASGRVSMWYSVIISCSVVAIAETPAPYSLLSRYDGMVLAPQHG